MRDDGRVVSLELEDEDARSLENYAGNRDALLLNAGGLEAALADHCGIAMAKARNPTRTPVRIYGILRRVGQVVRRLKLAS